MFKHVAHLTSVHSRNDTRIFIKQCSSLASAGYKVSLVVADGKGDECIDNINIYDVGVPNGRFDRIINTTRRIFEKAKSLDADMYHFHDPELIPIGLKLKKISRKVIFDSHEDVPKQMLHKIYLNKYTSWIASQCIRYYEKWACKKFDAIITATPFISEKFIEINPLTITINNYPILGELATENLDWKRKKNHVSFVGVISLERGIVEVVDAMDKVKSAVRLQLVGRIYGRNLEESIKSKSGWEKVDQLGFLNRASVKDVLSYSIAGLVTFYPLENHIDAQPNKMFEYMSAGIPVIGSNFPYWRKIIEGNECGFCVDPKEPSEIAEAVDFLLKNPGKAQEMGENGLRSVQKTYNWSIEEKKLFDLYKRLI